MPWTAAVRALGFVGEIAEAGRVVALGHRLGDQVLLQMAARLKRHLRPADTLARLGGDEFVIVVESVAREQDTVNVANRIVEAGRHGFQLGEEEFACTLSVGIAWTADPRRSAEDLLHEAVISHCTRPKTRGQDRAEIFDAELRTNAVSRLATERMVRRALEDSGSSSTTNRLSICGPTDSSASSTW